MPLRQAPDTALLDDAGLTLLAVFDCDALPEDVAAPLRAGAARPYRQLLLVGHAGRRLWQALQAAGMAGADPIDDFSITTVRRWLALTQPGTAYDIVYPGPRPIGLQRLGHLAGWHHDSPFKVGINRQWGSWFAYRAAVLADTDLEATPPLSGASPCAGCHGKPCIAACPASAMADGRFDLEKCLAYRRQPESPCRATCLARISCPVGAAHRYDDAQIAHSYLLSLRYLDCERPPRPK